MLIRCPSCAHAFEMAVDSLAVKATVSCPACTRVVVVRDAAVKAALAQATQYTGWIADVPLLLVGMGVPERLIRDLHERASS